MIVLNRHVLFVFSISISILTYFPTMYLLHFKFISIILSLNDGDFNRYDEDRLPTAIGNMLILEKGFATFNSFSLQNSFYVNNSYVKGTRRLPQVSGLSCLDNPIGYIHSPAQNYAERVFRFMEDCNDTFFWNYDIFFRTFFRFFQRMKFHFFHFHFQRRL